MVGYAARFNSRSKLIGGHFHEEVMPGAFTRTLNDGGLNVRALFNHDMNYVLGTRDAGTLMCREDANGLHVEIEPPDTSYARDLMTLVKRGDIRGMSFGFVTRSDKWSMRDGSPHRELHDVDLHDVSVVTDPAYADAKVNARSWEQFRDELAADSLFAMKMRLMLAERV